MLYIGGANSGIIMITMKITNNLNLNCDSWVMRAVVLAWPPPQSAAGMRVIFDNIKHVYTHLHSFWHDGCFNYLSKYGLKFRGNYSDFVPAPFAAHRPQSAFDLTRTCCMHGTKHRRQNILCTHSMYVIQLKWMHKLIFIDWQGHSEDTHTSTHTHMHSNRGERACEPVYNWSIHQMKPYEAHHLETYVHFN